MIFLNNRPVNVTQFPNNETKVDDKSIRQAIYVGLNSLTLKYESDADLIQLLFVKKYLDEANLTASLIIPYMPYSRMDRSEDASVFTLKYICEFINSLNFASVTLLEPHSDVAPALLNRVKLVFPTTKLLEVAKSHMSFSDEDYIFFPDAGAQKRYSKLAIGQSSLVGYKQRDFQTGKITSLELVGTLPTKPFKAIIVDDLSSYGGTFIAAAKELRKIGATEIYLVVAHAEKAILEGEIFKSELIQKVFTTDSILDMDDATERLVVYSEKIFRT